MTRTTDSDNSENLIENVAIGLYIDSADDTQSPVAFQTFDGFKDYNTHQVVMQLTDDMIATLFEGHGNQCRMFAVANLPASSSIPENPTIEDLKKIPVSSNFRTLKLQSSFVMTGEGRVTYTPPTGSEKVGSASGSADLYRAAAKIRLNLQIPDTIHVGNATDFVVWEPVKGNIRALMNNGVQQAISSPVGNGDEFWKPSASTAYYNSTLIDGSERGFTNTGTGTYTYVMDVPFYTYPNAWTETAAEDRKTSLTLIVNWGIQNQESWNTYYYQIPITPVELPHLDKNYSYTVNLKLGMLGSLTPEEEFPLENLSYQIVDWDNENVDVDIKDFRYLVVNPNVVTFYNETNMIIPFYSSHPVDDISDISMTFQRFNYYSNGNGDVVNIEVDKNIIDDSTWTHTIEENGTTKQVTDTIVNYEIIKDPATNQLSLKITHNLDIWTPLNRQNREVSLTNKSGSGDATFTAKNLGIVKFERPDNPVTPYSSYTFKVHIAHKDKPEYAEDITITQYPGMYITRDKNPGNGSSSNGGNSNVYNRKGNVYINNYPTTSTDNTYGVSNNWGSGTNSNPNMYIIQISQLDSLSGYRIGDPRMMYAYNDLPEGANALITPTSDQDPITSYNSWCKEANALYPNTNKRRLSYYYPTMETPVTEMMVAPKLRIASSYGKSLEPTNRSNSRRRIATYQELNCPAGRWRLPTKGELQFIVNLSQTGKIPVLFNSGSRYWTAHGLFTVKTNGTLSPSNRTTGFVRGVYDEWYWENSQYKITPDTNGNYTYTLGDVERGKQ